VEQVLNGDFVLLLRQLFLLCHHRFRIHLLLTASNITDTTADLAWTESGSATAWDIEVLTTGTPPTGVPTASGVTNPYILTGLMENTEYDYYVRANCGVDGTSALIGPFMF